MKTFVVSLVCAAVMLCTSMVQAGTYIAKGKSKVVVKEQVAAPPLYYAEVAPPPSAVYVATADTAVTTKAKVGPLRRWVAGHQQAVQTRRALRNVEQEVLIANTAFVQTNTTFVQREAVILEDECVGSYVD